MSRALLFLLVACHTSSEPEERPPKKSDSTTSGQTTTSTTTPAHTFDTAGPTCAGTLGDTGWIDSPPTVSCVTTLPVPSGAAGPTVNAEGLAFAKIIGTNKGRLGAAIVPLGDQNRDGIGEFAVGRPGRVGWYNNNTEGEVWIFDGSVLTGDMGRTDATTILTSRVQNDSPKYGDGSFLVTGDLTGDGNLNLISGGPGYIETFVLPLPLPAGLHIMDDLAVASIAAPGQSITDHPAVGDVTGDGLLDLSLSGRALYTPNGGVSVHAGPLTSLGIDPENTWASYHTKELDDPYEVSISQMSGRYMPGVVFDINGDGRQDVVVGGERLADPIPGSALPALNNGGFSWFSGGTAGIHNAADAQAVIYGECSGKVGYGLNRIGDVTGDCRPDLAVLSTDFALPGEARRGAIYVVSELHRTRGHIPIADVASAIIIGEDINQRLDTAGYLGDLNQDGFDDLLVGSPWAANGDGGKVYLFLGPVQGVKLASEADLTILGGGVPLGDVIRGVHDITGDGILDLAVGVPSSDDNNGMIYLFSGADLLAQLP